jgi:hypothetical protein
MESVLSGQFRWDRPPMQERLLYYWYGLNKNKSKKRVRSSGMTTAIQSDPMFQTVSAWVNQRLSPQGEFALKSLISSPTDNYALADAMRKANPTDWGNASNTSASKNISILRSLFAEHALSSDGIRASAKFSVTEGRKLALIKQANTLPPSTQFWLGHLDNGRRTSIVVGRAAPADGPRWRQHAAFATPVVDGVARPELADVDNRQLPPPPSSLQEELLSGDPYRTVRLGDVRALLSVYSYFRQWSTLGIGYEEPEVISSETAGELTKDNLVIIGSSARNGELSERDWDSRFNLSLMGGWSLVENLGEGMIGGHGVRNTQTDCVVLVSRSATGPSGRTLTLVNGAHALAVNAVCRLLTSETRIEPELLEPLGLRSSESGSAFPSDFQIAFEVHLSADESRAESIKVLRLQTLEKRRPVPANAIRVKN